MTSVAAKYRWPVLVAYPTAGLLLGLADPLLGRAAQQLGVKAGVATAVSVNLLLPLVAIALALIYARVDSVLLGALSMTSALIVGLAIQYHGGREWSFADVPPVLVAAAVG
jgi:hypothetical protein